MLGFCFFFFTFKSIESPSAYFLFIFFLDSYCFSYKFLYYFIPYQWHYKLQALHIYTIISEELMFLNCSFSNWGHLVYLHLFRSHLMSFSSFLHIGPYRSHVSKYVFATVSDKLFCFFSVYVVPTKICKFIYLFFYSCMLVSFFSGFYGF